jgi:MoaA/NifB/PqqE/SkfB family radical SAM enzyme
MAILDSKNLSQAQIKQFYIAMSNQCNLECLMCTTTTHKNVPDKELSLKQWEEVISNLVKYNVECIVFGGGEPLIRKDDLAVLVNLVTSKGITVNIVTNATLLERGFLDKLNSHKGRIFFLLSLDGLEQDNDLIRGKGVFKKVNEAAKLLQEYQREFFITSVLMPQNFSHYIDFMRFIVENYPKAYLDIQPIIPHNEIYYIRNKFELTKDQLNQLTGIIAYIKDNRSRMKLCRSVEIIEKYLDYFTNSICSKNQCKMGTQSFNINLRGNLWICGKELMYPLYLHSLEEIVNTPEYINEMQRVQRCNSPCLAGLVI